MSHELVERCRAFLERRRLPLVVVGFDATSHEAMASFVQDELAAKASEAERYREALERIAGVVCRAWGTPCGTCVTCIARAALAQKAPGGTVGLDGDTRRECPTCGSPMPLDRARELFAAESFNAWHRTPGNCPFPGECAEWPVYEDIDPADEEWATDMDDIPERFRGKSCREVFNERGGG